MTTVENAASTVKVRPRLKERYRNEIRDSLQKQFGYGNVMQIPTVTKVVVNMGVGEAARDAKLINGAVSDLAAITGQRPDNGAGSGTAAQSALASSTVREKRSTSWRRKSPVPWEQREFSRNTSVPLFRTSSTEKP